MRSLYLESHERQAAIEQIHTLTGVYTAEPVVHELLDRLDWPRGGRRLVDTSCGDGSFLGSALRRLLANQPAVDDAALVNLIQGYEIHAGAAAEARSRLVQILVCAGRSEDQAHALTERLVTCADFLTQVPKSERWHVIVGNPPYARLVRVPQPLRDEYVEALPAYATADLLHSFLDRCAELLAPDGEMALVSADRWLFAVGATRLREVIGAKLGIAHLYRLDRTSAFYRPKTRRRGTPPRVHPVAIVLRPAAACHQVLGADPIFPGAAVAPVAHGPTLDQIATIRLAPYLGTKGIFVVDLATAASLPSEYLVPAIDARDLSGGSLGPIKRMAIRTARDEQPHPAVAAHLDQNVSRMCRRGAPNARRWLPPEPFHAFDISQPSLVVPRIARSLRPVRIPAGVLPINHSLSIVTTGMASLDVLEEMLLAPESQDWMQARAAPLENGYWSVTPMLLRKLPVPSRILGRLSPVRALAGVEQDCQLSGSLRQDR